MIEESQTYRVVTFVHGPSWWMIVGRMLVDRDQEALFYNVDDL